MWKLCLYILKVNAPEFSLYSLEYRITADLQLEEGIVQGGMIPKLENSFSALDAGVSQVVITLASAIHKDSGTIIRK